MIRSNQPHAKRERQVTVLARRTKDVTKYTSVGEQGKEKLSKALADIKGLKSKLNIEEKSDNEQ